MTFKIAIFVTTLTPKGASQRRMQNEVLGSILQLASSNYEIVLLSYDSKDYSKELSVKHIPLQPLTAFHKYRSVLRSFFASFRYHLRYCSRRVNFPRLVSIARKAWSEPRHWYYIRSENIRLVYNMNQHTLNVPVPFVKTIWDVNHRVHSYFPEFSYSRHTFSGLEASIVNSINKASYIVTGTKAGGDQLKTIYGVLETKIRVIPFPAPLLSDNVSVDIIPITKSPFLLYPARLWPHKNHYVILRALKVLNDFYDYSINAVFTGRDEGNLSYLLSAVEDLGLSSQVVFLGEVDDCCLVSLYQTCLALVFASPCGPDNLPPLEAMSLGCPAIVAVNEGSSEQLKDAALFFSAYNEYDLAEKILSIISDSVLRLNLIEKGYNLASRLTPESYATSVISIFDEFTKVSRCWERCDSSFT